MAKTKDSRSTGSRDLGSSRNNKGRPFHWGGSFHFQETQLLSNNYVVYRHYVGDVTIYIGVGYHARAIDFHRRSKRWREYVVIHGKPSVEILHDGLTKAEAHAIEIELIALHKRECDGGSLLNISIGGMGGTSGVKFSPETRAAMSAAAKGKPKPPRSDEHLAAMSAAKLGKKRSPHRAETLAKMSESACRPETRERKRQGMLAHFAAKRAAQIQKYEVFQ
jgi:hypothetical protein